MVVGYTIHNSIEYYISSSLLGMLLHGLLLNHNWHYNIIWRPFTFFPGYGFLSSTLKCISDVTEGRGNVRFGLPWRNFVSEILRGSPPTVPPTLPPQPPPPIIAQAPLDPTEVGKFSSEDDDMPPWDEDPSFVLLLLLLLLCAGVFANDDKDDDADEDEQAEEDVVVVVVVLAIIEPCTEEVADVIVYVAVIVAIAVIVVLLEIDFTLLLQLPLQLVIGATAQVSVPLVVTITDLDDVAADGVDEGVAGEFVAVDDVPDEDADDDDEEAVIFVQRVIWLDCCMRTVKDQVHIHDREITKRNHFFPVKMIFLL